MYPTRLICEDIGGEIVWLDEICSSSMLFCSAEKVTSSVLVDGVGKMGTWEIFVMGLSGCLLAGWILPCENVADMQK